MPRPKPPEELKPRCIRMSDSEWFVFRSIGGADWLRSRLEKTGKLSNFKAIRNKRMRMDWLGGMSMEAVGKKYGLDRTTVWRIVQ